MKIEKSSLGSVGRFLYFGIAVFLLYIIFSYAIQAWEVRKSINLYRTVSAEALAVVYAPSLSELDVFNHQKSFWQYLSQFTFFKQNQSAYLYFAQIADSVPAFKEILNSHAAVISLHLLSKKKMGVLYSIKFLEEKIKTESYYLPDTIAAYFQYTYHLRRYNNVLVYEFFAPEGDMVFACSFYKNCLLVSTDALLVEDGLRTADGDRNDFYQEVRRFEKQEDVPYLYLHTKKINQFLEVFTEQATHFQPYADILRFKQNSDSTENWCMNGEAVFRKEAHWGANFLAANSLKSSHVVVNLPYPTQTAYAYTYHFTDGKQFLSLWNEYHSAEPLQQAWQKEWGINIADLFDTFFGKIVIMTLEGATEGQSEKVVTVNCFQPQQAKEILSQKGEQAGTDKSGKYPIYKFAATDFPFKYFKENLPQGVTYVAVTETHVLWCSSLWSLKRYLDEISQSVKMTNQQIQTTDENNAEITDLQTNSLYINIPRAWYLVLPYLDNEHRLLFENTKRKLLKLQDVSIKISQKNTQIAVNIPTSRPLQDKVKSIFNIVLDETANSELLTVKTNAGYFTHIFLQDDEQVLYCLSKKGELLWKGLLAHQVSKNMVEFTDNQQKDYIFSSKNLIYAVSSNGQYLPSFPFVLPPYINTEFLSVAHNPYQLIVADRSGQVFIFDKAGKIYPDWQPKNLSSALVKPCEALRLANKDYVLAVTAKGTIHLNLLKGGSANGFPLPFNKSVQNFVVRQGKTEKDTYLYLFCEDGEVIVIDLSGKIINRKTAQFGSDAECYYFLDEVSTQNYLLAVKKENQIAVYKSDNTSLFHIFASQKHKYIFQLFDFGGNTEVIAVTDITAEQTKLYYLNGDLLIEQPLKSDRRVMISYDPLSAIFYIYKVYDDEVSCVSLHK
jgi:hypothetical protein